MPTPYPLFLPLNKIPNCIYPSRDQLTEMKLKSWFKTVGYWGLLFFAVKGLLWLTIPALIAFFATN